MTYSGDRKHFDWGGITAEVDIYDVSGKKISSTELQKGQKMQIFYNGVLERYPPIYTGVYKIQILE